MKEATNTDFQLPVGVHFVPWSEVSFPEAPSYPEGTLVLEYDLEGEHDPWFEEAVSELSEMNYLVFPDGRWQIRENSTHRPEVRDVGEEASFEEAKEMITFWFNQKIHEEPGFEYEED